LWISLCVVSHAGNLVGNPGFESGPATWGMSGNVAYDYSTAAASEGDWLMRFNGAETSPNGVIAQVLATQPGEHYKLEFDLAGHLQGQVGIKVELFNGFGSGGTVLIREEMVNQLDGAVYVRRHLEFTAISANATLVFTDISADANGTDLLIDNVSVTTTEDVAVGIQVRRALRAELQFQTVGGGIYNILASSSPAGPFLPIRTIIGDGSTVTFCDSRDLEVSQFYQVVLVK